MGNNDFAPETGDTAGPVAGEALKDGARWPGYGLIALGLVAVALSLAGFAVGRNSLATIGAVVAVLAVAAGVSWQFVEHRRLRNRHGSGTPERPEDAAPLK
ncbi:LapA family protein [Mycolicibacterium sp.]|uniref:LapA family protein n=1 Tax=Mycolicibacterium sp. TaxID=2320850 RepID=UPI001A1F5AC9|nr:LapA family protein [Mycolicibacterium sp.]MBJ7338832.1 LapA family protein [Mycolicibacterium sp.]